MADQRERNELVRPSEGIAQVDGLVIYAVDVGSVEKGNFGWQRRLAVSSELSDRCGDNPKDLVTAAAYDLVRGVAVALGFECPLWIDLPADPIEHTRRRNGEPHNRAWSAGAGAAVLATGIVQTAWILRELRSAAPNAKAFLRWAEFAEAKAGLFLWEALVTGAAKTRTHEGDARKAADTFAAALGSPAMRSAVTPRGDEVISLIGSALLRTGWTMDFAMMNQPCLVIQPS